MATISTLAVNLVARTAIFEKNMNRSRRTAKGFKGTLQNMGRTLKRFAGGLLAVAGAGAMLLVIKRTMTAIDVTAKLSRRLGIATEELIALQHAASIVGVEQQSLNKSIDIFVRRLGELKTGAGEATRGLELLGLKGEELVSKSPLENIKLIAEEIRRLPNQAEKAAAAYFLFGRAGAQLVNLFELGAKGIEDFQEEAEKLGITFSQFDAAKVEQANDAFTRMKALLRGVTQSAVIGLSPILEAITLQFIDIGINADAGGKLALNAFEGIIKFGLKVAKIVTTIKIFFERLVATILGVGSIIVKAVGFVSGNETIKAFGEAMDVVATEMQASAKKAFANLQEDDGISGFFQDVRKRADELKRQLEADAAKRAELAKGGLGGFDPDAFENMQKQAEQLKESLKSPIEKLKDLRGEYEKLLNAKLITEDEFTKGLRAAAEKLLDVSKATTKGRPFDFGEAKEISSLVSVKGLSGFSDPVIGKMDTQIALQEETNELLRQIENKTEVTA